MEGVDSQLHPERLKVITQQVPPEQRIHSLAQLQHKHEQLDTDVTPACSPQVRAATATIDDRRHAHRSVARMAFSRDNFASHMRVCCYMWCATISLESHIPATFVVLCGYAKYRVY